MDSSNPNKPPSLTFVGKAGILPLEWSLIRNFSTFNKDRVALLKATYDLIHTFLGVRYYKSGQVILSHLYVVKVPLS